MKTYSRKSFLVALFGVLTGAATLASCAGSSRGGRRTNDRGNKRTDDRPGERTNDN